MVSKGKNQGQPSKSTKPAEQTKGNAVPPTNDKEVKPTIQKDKGANAAKSSKKDKGANPAKPKLGIYIHRVLKKVDTDGYSLGKATVSQVSAMLMYFARTLAARAAAMANKVTVDERAVLLAMKSLLNEHHSQTLNRPFDALRDFKASHGTSETESWSAKANLVLPPSLFRGMLRKVGKRVSLLAPVFFAGVMEEILTTMLVAAKTKAASLGEKRLSIKHVMGGVQDTPLLKHILDHHVHVVVPGFHEACKAKKDSKAKGETKAKASKKQREIGKAQLQAAPFKRLCVSTLNTIDSDKWRFSADFLDALQAYIESYTVQQFRVADELAHHAKRKVVKAKDVHAMLHIQPTHRTGSIAPVKSMESGMRRLARVAGVTSVSPGAIVLMQQDMHAHLHTVLNTTSMVAMSQRLKTLGVDHLKESLSLHGVCMA